MAKEAIKRLGYKILKPDREYFSIKKEDRESMEEIIKNKTSIKSVRIVKKRLSL